MAKTTPGNDGPGGGPIGEFGLIERYLAPLAGAAGLGLKDDAAVLVPPPGRELVMTSDTMVAGVHFLANEAPDAIAAKLLRVNLSDLAAMGAVPWAYTLNLALVGAPEASWMTAFCGALAADQKTFGISLVGGDTVSTPAPPSFTATALGHVAPGGVLRRNGGQAGDEIWVSGTIGDAYLGLGLLTGDIDPQGTGADSRAYLTERHRRPTPRLSLGQGLAAIPGVTAAMDVSDGLAGDLEKLCAASGQTGEISIDSMPLSDAARSLVRNNQELHRSLLSGGDDYELVFTAAASAADAVVALGADVGVPVSRIGRLGSAHGGPQNGLRVYDVIGGEPIEVTDGGYRHF